MTAEELRNPDHRRAWSEHCTLEGDGRHWYATIVSTEFEGKRLIQRHQMVYATLGARRCTPTRCMRCR
jgi:acid stress-induced BolA-like protein IbaG/YrbA